VERLCRRVAESQSPGAFSVEWAAIGPSEEGFSAEASESPPRADSALRGMLVAGMHVRAALSSSKDPGITEHLRQAADQLDVVVAALAIGATADADVGESPAREVRPPVEVAWVDRSGVIGWVNQSWVDFCRQGGGDPEDCGVGVSYLGICDAAGDPWSVQVAAAIRSALGGSLLPPQVVLVPCHGPDTPRWFNLAVYPTVDSEGATSGATITLWEVAQASPEQASEVVSMLRETIHAIDNLLEPDSWDDLASSVLDVRDASQAVYRALVLLEPAGAP